MLPILLALFSHVCCSAAQVANASGVLFSPLPGQDVEQMTCHGRECDLPLTIWASMVPRSMASAIAEVRWMFSSVLHCRVAALLILLRCCLG